MFMTSSAPPALDPAVPKSNSSQLDPSNDNIPTASVFSQALSPELQDSEMIITSWSVGVQLWLASSKVETVWYKLSVRWFLRGTSLLVSVQVGVPQTRAIFKDGDRV